MSVWSILRARVRGLLHRDGVADEIRDELDFHVQMRVEEYQRAGASADAARRLTSQRVGNLAVLRDRGYDERGGGMLETLRQDLNYGLRLLWRQKGFSVLAIGTLALGIGLSTALASVLDAALLRPLPYPHAEQLMRVSVTVPQRNGRTVQLATSYDDIEALRSSAHDLAAVSMWASIFVPPIVDAPDPERLRGMQIDDAYLGMYGVTPIIGRAITSADMRDGADPVLLLGYDYWKRRYQASTSALGQIMRFDDGVFTIVGVLPSTFGHDTPIWRPLHVTSMMQHIRGSGAVVMARLRNGVSREDAEREITDVLSRLPRATSGQSATLTSLLGDAIQQAATTATVLASAVCLVLVIACVNVAALLLARGATRESELAIRASIGADRARLIRQLLTESVLLAAIGGLAGAIVAWWTLDALVANIPLSLPADAPATLNWRVLTFSAALAMSSGLLFGLAPALGLSRVRLSSTLARTSRRAGSALSRRSGRWLVGVETALALLLLVGAGLMLRSFERILGVDLGFKPESIVTIEATPVAADAVSYANYYTSLVGALQTLPGVSAAGAINNLPLAGSATFGPVQSAASGQASAGIRQVLPGYFEAMGLAPREGRLPTTADFTSGRHVVVLNVDAVKQFFPDGHAVGQSIVVGKEDSEVVGVMNNIRFNGPLMAGWGGSPGGAAAEVFQLYRPSAATRLEALTVVVRPTRAGSVSADQLKQVAQRAGTHVLVERVRGGEDWLGDRIRTPKRRTVLLSLLGALGFVLALVGIFGITAYSVARRTREIGVRMAFGASPADVVRTILRDTAAPVAIGLVAGIGIALGATRVISTFLFETTPTDPATFAIVAATLGAAACLAAWIPSRRAARINPVEALRSE